MALAYFTSSSNALYTVILDGLSNTDHIRRDLRSMVFDIRIDSHRHGDAYTADCVYNATDHTHQMLQINTLSLSRSAQLYLSQAAIQSQPVWLLYQRSSSQWKKASEISPKFSSVSVNDLNSNFRNMTRGPAHMPKWLRLDYGSD